MIRIDGEAPDLRGATCQELYCQQCVHRGRIEDEADVVLLKFCGQWYQLYFDGGVVHWRVQDDPPAPREASDDALFTYPLADLGRKLGLRDQVISDCRVMETGAGETVSLLFTTGAEVEFINSGDSTVVRFKPPETG